MRRCEHADAVVDTGHARGPRLIASAVGVTAKRNAAALLRAIDTGEPLASLLDTCGALPCAQTLRELVQLVREQSRSQCASRAATEKNAVAREWVCAAWAGRSDASQSKGSFARQYAALLKQRFGVSLTDRQIAERWLPKC